MLQIATLTGDCQYQIAHFLLSFCQRMPCDGIKYFMLKIADNKITDWFAQNTFYS